jgi:hypothetical protein
VAFDAHAQAQAPPAATQPANPGALPQRLANYTMDGNLLRASFSYRDVLADPVLLKKLSGGLNMVIAMRAYVYPDGQDMPIQLAPRVCKVTYELWEDAYRIHISDPEQSRDTGALTIAGVVRICTEPQDLAIVRRELLTPGQAYFLGVVVDVDPVSPQMLQQMQQWMNHPAGSASVGPTNALFGTFAQLFTKPIAPSAKTLTFRTQSVVP